ncbi:unnamed protein product [Arctia plantaginis]|uniref:Phospholipid scramblase n=1 Tax=Arctia plantaginis TaxID=874455 RepID=A0A8S1BHB4_ARCPL|nr:unnamed protein product [Arctia plantaginis]CAB3258691.1 unnamed protein product [Arctia plantaginis]
MIAAPIPKIPSLTIPEEVKVIPSVKIEPTVVDSLQQEFVEPPLLNELTTVDRLLITKRLPVKNVLCMRGKKNRFFVRTSDQNLIYTIEEENNWWVGYLCYGLRPLQLRVRNCHGMEVMTINRPFAFTSRVLPCQLQTLEIFSPPGHLIGTVQQQWTALRPLYLVLNERGDSLFWIRGPVNTLTCFKDVQFQIQRTDGEHVGATCKRWQGLTHALFFAPVSDRFGVAFEQNLTVEEKALLMSVTILLDYMYYDS